MFANRMSTYKSPAYTCPFVDPSEWEGFRNSFHLVRFVMNAIHELLGHGTGKLLSETSLGEFNFDKEHPPINPLTDKPIDTWYHVGETWSGLGGKLANTVEECRANLVSFFFADNRDLLSLFGYNDSSSPTADDCKCDAAYSKVQTDFLQSFTTHNSSLLWKVFLGSSFITLRARPGVNHTDG